MKTKEIKLTTNNGFPVIIYAENNPKCLVKSLRRIHIYEGDQIIGRIIHQGDEESAIEKAKNWKPSPPKNKIKAGQLL